MAFIPQPLANQTEERKENKYSTSFSSFPLISTGRLPWVELSGKPEGNGNPHKSDFQGTVLQNKVEFMWRQVMICIGTLLQGGVEVNISFTSQFDDAHEEPQKYYSLWLSISISRKLSLRKECAQQSLHNYAYCRIIYYKIFEIIFQHYMIECH